MRDYTKINVSIWQSRKFKNLSDFDKLVYLYLLTNSQVNSLGCYRLVEDYALVDLKCSLEAFRKAIDSLSELLRYSIDSEIIYIFNFISQQPPTNKKHAIGMINLWKKLPDCIEKTECIQQLKGNKHAMTCGEYDSLPIAYAKPIDTTEIETETETETETESSLEMIDDDKKNKLLELMGLKKNYDTMRMQPGNWVKNVHTWDAFLKKIIDVDGIEGWIKGVVSSAGKISHINYFISAFENNPPQAPSTDWGELLKKEGLT
jgi:hypothetical protein